MKPDKHLLGAAGIILAATGLITLTWVGTMRAIHAQRTENTARVTATLSNQALTFTEQINRQLLALDQTLRILATSWETNSRRFDLEANRGQASVLSGLSRDMLLTDENGIIRQSSVAEAINQNVSGLDFFRTLSNPSDPGDQMFIGSATIDNLMRQWHMNVARALHNPDGSFAGTIVADYRIAAVTDVFSQTDLGSGSLVTLAGLDDGKLRGAVGPATIDPDASVGDTLMFAAISDAESGIWTGPSANDAVQRIHAYRRLPNRRLAVVVAMNEQEAMRPATEWRQQAQVFAGCITTLLIGLALILIQGTRKSREREAIMAEDRAILAASNAQLEVARAFATAKAEQLEVTLAGMTDGVSMVDAHMCLVEWNARFPEVAGIPAEILRVGLPMEELLRAQIATGQFGFINDPETEVERRMARLRVAPYGVVQRLRPDGHTLELRRNRLPDGGFVTLYSDVTEHKRVEEALRAAQEAAETANAERARFVAIVSHEIRTPLNALLNSVRLLSDSVLTPTQKSLLTMARQSGDVLFGLVNDILDMSQMEAGKLAIRPSLFELAPLLESAAEIFATQGAQRGMSFHVAIEPGTPATLLTDPGRLRQVLLNLVSNAVKYAGPGQVWLTAEPGLSPSQAVRLTVRDDGPVIDADARAGLFRPFSRLDRPDGDQAIGNGLGLSICHHLMTLMGAQIGCDAWSRPDGSAGNVFWMVLPAAALPARTTAPAQAGPANIPDCLPPRRLPRTRILLTEDIIANQMITATLLRREGHHVDIAGSGQAAVDALRTTPYDLVFMDIFMPGMGGQEATRIIRELPEPACSTPVVALTANVSAADKALFQAAGMDGIVGKPVSLNELLDALRTYVWSPGPHTPAPNTKDVAVSHESPVLSEERIRELRTNLPAATFAELVEQCLEDMDLRMPALRRALAAGIPGAITAHAHAMVGMAGGYGMAAMENRLRDVLSAARDGDLTPLGTSLIADLDADFVAAARELRELVRGETV